MKARRKMHGCLKAFLVGLGAMVVFVLLLRWMVLDSVWKAESICRGLHLGMNVLEVDPILHAQGYRLRCVYQVRVAGDWKDVTRAEFADALKAQKPGAPQEFRVWVQVFGAFAPASFIIGADGTGRVVDISQPKPRG